MKREITEKRFCELFESEICGQVSNPMEIVAILSNERQVIYETGKNQPSHRGYVNFYKQGSGHMEKVFRTNDYDELVKYLKNNPSEYWRVEEKQ